MTGKRNAIAALVLTLLASAPASAAPEDDCHAAPAREDWLDSVGERGELVLASRERAVLSGIRWPDDAGLARAAKDWLESYRGRPLTLVRRGDPDRWGRVRVDASTAPDGATDLAGALVAEGLVFADAGEVDTLCRPELLALETDAREAARGVWTVAVRDARDGPALQRVEGDFIVAQGRIRAVGERRNRTYLDFAPWGETGLTVTVPKRTWRIMGNRGLTTATLKGRLVRVRGRVEVWRGPVLEIASADMIELLEGEQALRR